MGARKPWFVMRYTADDLSTIPTILEQHLATGGYNAAVVGACPAESEHNFTAYSIAVLLYR